MNLINMAKKIETIKITRDVSKGVKSQAIPVKAADLLKDLAEKKGFQPEDPSCEFMGSADHVQLVRDAIRDRWGEEISEEYEPAVNVKPKTAWLQDGYVILEGEIPLCFVSTYRNGQRYSVALYHEKQMKLSV